MSLPHYRLDAVLSCPQPHVIRSRTRLASVGTTDFGISPSSQPKDNPTFNFIITARFIYQVRVQLGASIPSTPEPAETWLSK
ncbi:hypothetical protein DSO57_1006235 [Entomophthora muscae]|uniref:Uncharacterized protein n=1 Tax=Entomophthora muscae TaxID=34485 RepID=A0ACC2RYS7_9FUNG|nr:hypothetical protein DSO57_1006235 [Entomophthora muscae]